MQGLFRIILICLASTVQLWGQDSFHFFGTEVRAGTKVSVKIPIAAGSDSTFIPVTVFHGKVPGPVLGITAGVHGFEYPPILAAQKIAKTLNPENLKGTVILVQIANVPSFLGRSPFNNPMDGKNLNRIFPGSSEGSITERMAYNIVEHVIGKSDFFVDMHGGDAPEDLRPYNAWYQSEALPEASKKGREMALAMGYDYTVIFKIPAERLKSPSLYCSQEAFHRNIPSVDIECGRLGIAGEEETGRIVDSIFLLLSHLGMLPENNTAVKTPTLIAERVTVKSKRTGIFYSTRKAGDLVTKGDTIGHITDFFGQKLEDIIVPADGMIIYMIGTPPVNKGETLMNIGILE